MGAVWRARDELLDVDVAVKQILLGAAAPDRAGHSGGSVGSAAAGDGAADADHWVEHALREARNAARLRANPHVVTVHDAVVDEGMPWIVMDFVAARSLQEAVATAGPLARPRVATVGLAVLDALVAGQRLGVVHRDVKPSNILLADDGRVLLTDFGIAAHASDPTLVHVRESGSPPSGTPAYMAPERLRGGPATLAADLFSLGATLLFAATGQAPFHRDTVLASMRAVLDDEPVVGPDVGALWPVVGGLLAKDPARRLPADGARALMIRALREDARPDLDPPDLGPPDDGPPDHGPADHERPHPDLASSGQRDPAQAPRDPAQTEHDLAGHDLAGHDLDGVGPDHDDAVRLVPDLAVEFDADSWDWTVAREYRGPARRLRGLVAPGVVAVLALVLLAGGLVWIVGAVRDPPSGANGRRVDGRATATATATATASVASPAPSAPATGRSVPPDGAPTGQAGAVPAGMIGHWTGTVTQGEEEHEFTVDLRGGALDAVVGTSSTDQGCVSDLVLREPGLARILVQEVLTRDSLWCTDIYRLQLSLQGDGTLALFYDPTLVSSAGLGNLTRE
jgi:hypothetical protein